MKFQNLSVALMLSAGLAIGCEEAKDATTSATDSAQDAASSAADKTGGAMDSLKTEAAEAGEAMKDAGAEALEASKEKASEAMEAGKAKMDEAVEAGKDKINEMTGGAMDETKSSASDAASGISLDSLKEGMSLDAGQVDGIIEKVKGLIGDKNYDTAQQWISKLEGMQLPEGYADKVSGLKGLLEKAQGAGDMLKGLGG